MQMSKVIREKGMLFFFLVKKVFGAKYSETSEQRKAKNWQDNFAVTSFRCIEALFHTSIIAGVGARCPHG